jgi:hypothetical protein
MDDIYDVWKGANKLLRCGYPGYVLNIASVFTENDMSGIVYDRYI